MLIAEIRKKLQDLTDEDLTPADLRKLLADTKEDLLTADVFGALKYLPRRPYLEEVLRKILAQTLTPDRVESVLCDLDQCRFEFWPSYRAPEGISGGNTQPDVVISSPRALIFFEMKLHAGLGQAQIERQLAIALREASPGQEVFVVVVNAGVGLPRLPGGARTFNECLTYQQANGALAPDLVRKLQEASSRVLWINWGEIRTALDRALQIDVNAQGDNAAPVARARDLIEDLRTLLTMRGILEFRGFAGLRSGGPLNRGRFLGWTALQRVVHETGAFDLKRAVSTPAVLPVCLWALGRRQMDGRSNLLRFHDVVARWPEPAHRCGLAFGGQSA